MAADKVGANPTGRPRRSSAGKRRQAEKRDRSPRISEAAGRELELAAADYAASPDVRQRMDARDRRLRAA